jgi:hypothetical protein
LHLSDVCHFSPASTNIGYLVLSMGAVPTTTVTSYTYVPTHINESNITMTGSPPFQTGTLPTENGGAAILSPINTGVVAMAVAFGAAWVVGL